MAFSEGPSDPLLDLVCFLSYRIELSCIDTTEMILSDWCDTAQCNAQVTWANWPMVLGGVKIRNSQCWLLLLTYIAISKWKCFVKSISNFPDLVFIKKRFISKRIRNIYQCLKESFVVSLHMRRMFDVKQMSSYRGGRNLCLGSVMMTEWIRKLSYIWCLWCFNRNVVQNLEICFKTVSQLAAAVSCESGFWTIKKWKVKKTSQELRRLSSVTINCQVTKIVINSGFQLSVL